MNSVIKLPGSPKCPVCAKTLNGAAAVGHDSAPEPGDVTICIGCGTVLEFGPDRKSYSAISDDEMFARLDVDQVNEFLRVRSAILHLNKSKGRHQA